MSKEKEKRFLFIKYSNLKKLIFLLLDSLIIFFSYLFVYLIQYSNITSLMFLSIGVILVFKIIVYSFAGIYKSLVDHISIMDEILIGTVILVTNLVIFSLMYINVFEPIRIRPLIFILLTCTEGLGEIFIRLIKRMVRFYNGRNTNGKRTMIVGAGAAAKVVYSECHTNTNFNNKIICYIDDSLDKIGSRYLGSPVIGPISNIKEFIKKYEIEEVIIAINNIDKQKLKEIYELLSDSNVKVKRLPILSEMDVNKSMAIKDVSLVELLGREQVIFSDSEIKTFIENRRVLVTGGGGSIGSELCRQILSFNPRELVIFDIYENNAYDIEQELKRKIIKNNLNISLKVIIGSTYNLFRVEEVFNKFKPEIVFHAAAYKHVPLMEENPVEAIRTNVIGTYNVAKMVDKYNTLKMVLVSTDKAVRSTNTMGATKRLAEMIIQYFSQNSKSSYSAVRFGNVLGSNGSVIPLFKKQIEEGGPVTVTDKDIVRYFMTIPEAVSLILQSGVYAKGGEIFILDMGKPVKIITLAENLIRECGFTPYEDIDIKITGLRPGEKIFEELLLDTTKCEKTENAKIFIEKKQDIYPIEEYINKISIVFEMTDNEKIKDELKKIVLDYRNYIEFNNENK